MRQTIVALILMLFAQTALAGLGGHQWHLAPADNSHAPNTHQHIKLDKLAQLSQQNVSSSADEHSHNSGMELCTQCGCHSAPSTIVAETSFPASPQQSLVPLEVSNYLPPAIGITYRPPIA